MSFLSKLNTCCGEYTGFNYNGYVIQLPYYLGGKKLPSTIKTSIDNWRGNATKTKEEIQAFVTSNPSLTGIDCSGLVYYVLNEASSGAVRS